MLFILQNDFSRAEKKTKKIKTVNFSNFKCLKRSTNISNRFETNLCGVYGQMFFSFIGLVQLMMIFPHDHSMNNFFFAGVQNLVRSSLMTFLAHYGILYRAYICNVAYSYAFQRPSF